MRENEWQRHLGILGKRLDSEGAPGVEGGVWFKQDASKQVDQAFGWSLTTDRGASRNEG